MFHRFRKSKSVDKYMKLTLSLDADDDEVIAELDLYSKSVLTLPCIY